MGELHRRCFDLGRHGDRPVLVSGDEHVHAAELITAVGRAAAALRARGITRGDRVAWLGPTDPDTVVGLLGVQAAGAIAVPLNPRHTPGELQHVVDDSDSVLVVAHPSLHDRVVDLDRPHATSTEFTTVADTAPAMPPCDVDDGDTALLVYTSGTTGKSKGVAIPWRALVSNMSALGSLWGVGPRDTCCVMLPLFHVHGLCIGIYAMLLAGATIHLHPRFDMGALVADFRDRGATVLLAVPTMYVALLEHLAVQPDGAAALRRARLFTAGSAPLSPAVLDAFEAATGHRILERYGMTETLITLSNPLHGERRPGSVGMPVPGVEIRVVGEDGSVAPPGVLGELQVRGDSIMSGYWRDAAATAAAFADGWFRTGDVVVRDADGRVRIVGRMSTDIVKSGGFKISTREIEDLLRTHALVHDVAVVGVADDRWGERVVAVVASAAAGAIAGVVAALERHCREGLADYKRPRQWILVDALPRNAMGKVEKVQLRATIERDYVGDTDARRTHSQ